MLRVVDTEWINYRQTWRGSVLSAFLGPLLYLGAIGFGLGSLVEADGAGLGTTSSGEAIGYLAFLAPGLVASTGTQVAANEAIFGTMARAKWRLTWQTAIDTPLLPADLALAHVVWMGLRGGLAAVVYAFFTVVFGILDPAPALVTVGPAVLGGLGLGAVLAALLVVTTEEHMMNAAQRFVVIPMFLFSGVFFPITQLPGWMQAVAKATPLWHAVELARRTALDVPTAWGTATHTGYLVAALVLGTLLCVRGFGRRLHA